MTDVRRLKYELVYPDGVLGHGSYGLVIRATEGGSNRSVALKKSRVRTKVKRPTLQHEARILQHLQGHPAIPAVYGYGRLRHFEYMAMELLGPSVAEKKQKGAALMVKTVIRLVDQALAALRHVHSIAIIHRDIKPGNFICVLDDPSTIKLIDFGISKRFPPETPGLPKTKYDPLQDRRHIIGTPYWASLNSHNGEDLAPRDDLESLSLTALFLLRGNLPWEPRPRLEAPLRSQEIIRIMKLAWSITDLCAEFPYEFGQLLDYSRSLAYHQLPDYEALRISFLELSSRMGYSPVDEPLDWTPCYPQTTNPIPEGPTVSISDEIEDGVELDEETYIGLDIDTWAFRPGERAKDVTLPAEQEAELDSAIPVIEEVEGNRNYGSWELS